MSLEGHLIWVTRPEAQAEKLCQMIEREGGACLKFPLLEIQSLQLEPAQAQRLQAMDGIDIIIFISANAVKYACRYVSRDVMQGPVTLAVGMATAEQCYNSGFTATSANEADSEGLLALDELQTKMVRGKSVAILRGRGGRELLAQTLLNRGASVEYFELYQRVCPEYSHKQQDSQWSTRQADIILITSAEMLDNLLSVTPLQYHEAMWKTSLVVMSERIAEKAVNSGFTGSITVCQQRSDEGLIQACKQSLANTDTIKNCGNRNE